MLHIQLLAEFLVEAHAGPTLLQGGTVLAAVLRVRVHLAGSPAGTVPTRVVAFRPV